MALGQEACRPLVLYGLGGPGLHARRMGVLALGAPAVCGRWLRWGLRSPWRFAGLLSALFFLYEGLTHAGFFATVGGAWQK
eukprot:7982998-Lingulodinium_polyedra.AAC.1